MLNARIDRIAASIRGNQFALCVLAWPDHARLLAASERRFKQYED